MKKFIRTMLVLVLALVSFGLAACDDNSAPAVNAQDAIKMLLVGQDAYVTEDFSVPGTLNYKGEQYPLTWTSNNTHLAVSATVDANGNYVIDATIPETEAQYVTLTATVKIGESTASKSFEFSLYPVSVYEIGEAYIFEYHKKSTSKPIDLDSEFTFEGKTATITWSVPTAYASIISISNGQAVFDEVPAATEVQLVATFSYNNETFDRTFKVNLVPGANAPTIITEFADGDAYKLGVLQGATGKYYYFAGSSANKEYYMSTTEDVAAATDVVIKVVEGGYHLTFVDSTGATKYLDMALSGTYFNVYIKDTPANVWVYDAELQTFYQEIDGTKALLGTYSTYTTLSGRTYDKVADTYICHMYVPAYVPVETPVAGQTYKLGCVQGSVGSTIYFTGTSANKEYYLSTSTNANKAVDVKVVEVTGGYHLSFVDSTGATKYLDMSLSGTYFNVYIKDTPTNVWVYDTELKTFYQEIDGTKALMGTYSSYTTLSGRTYDKVADTFIAQLYALAGSTDNGSAGGNGDSGSTGAVTSIATALTSPDGTAVVLTGKVIGADAWNSQYGNMSVTIEDSEGNSIYVYRLSTQVGLGDTIKVTGTMTTYADKGTRQVAQGATAVIIERAPVVDPNSYLTLSFASDANRTAYSTSQQVWTQNGVTLTNDKASSTTNVNNSFNPVRLYKSSSVTISSTSAFNKVEIYCSAADYFSSSFTVEGATVSASGLTIVITFDSAVTSFEITSLPQQIRVTEVRVYKA